MEFEIQQAREILARTPLVLRRWLAGLDDAWLHSNYGPDTFSPIDVLGHLIHGERADWIPRARMILEHAESRPFEPFDRYAQFEDSRGKSLPALLDEFEICRAESLRALDALRITPETLARRGLHPALGPVTLGQLLATWTAHDLNHLAQIARCMATQYADAVGPWREYLSVLNQSATKMDTEGARRRAASLLQPANNPPPAARFAQPVPFSPRPIQYRGLREHAGWRLKEYSIALAGRPLDDGDFDAGRRMALAELPSAPVSTLRPGVGFLILHAGDGAAYVVVCWWDNQNELPIRVFVRRADESDWRPAGTTESVCVWDLEVIGFERQAYVETVLAQQSDVGAYLSCAMRR